MSCGQRDTLRGAQIMVVPARREEQVAPATTVQTRVARVAPTTSTTAPRKLQPVVLAFGGDVHFEGVGLSVEFLRRENPRLQGRLIDTTHPLWIGVSFEDMFLKLLEKQCVIVIIL